MPGQRGHELCKSHSDRRGALNAGHESPAEVIEAKKAIRELQNAKKNREAVSGIFVFAKGCEPPEFGNFNRIDNDYYCTVDKAVLVGGGPSCGRRTSWRVCRR